MSDPASHQFTPREQYLVSYFRDPAWSKARLYFGYDIAFAVGALFMLWKFYAAEHAEPVFVYVACALLLGRLYYLTTEGARFAEDYRNIFRKYEARLADLEAQLKAKEPVKE